MSTDPGLVRREQLEHNADLARSRLATILGALNQRRQRVLDWREQAHRHLPELAVAGISTALAIVGGVTFRIIQARRNAAQVNRQRWMALERAWKHPERVAGYKPRSLFAEIGRRVLIGLATYVGSQIGKRMLKRSALPPPQPQPPITVKAHTVG
jgi:hypothetical protein